MNEDLVVCPVVDGRVTKGPPLAHPVARSESMAGERDIGRWKRRHSCRSRALGDGAQGGSGYAQHGAERDGPVSHGVDVANGTPGKQPLARAKNSSRLFESLLDGGDEAATRRFEGKRSSPLAAAVDQ